MSYEATRLGMDETATKWAGETEQLDLGPGIAAAIADPLWMLGRQWQLGEFTGEDAASPVHVQAETEHTTLTMGGPWAPRSAVTPMLPIAADLPLETLVEREVVTLGPGQFAHAAAAGLHLLRLMDVHGLTDYKPLIRETFPLPTPETDRMRPGEVRAAELMRRRSLNGFVARLTLRRIGVAAAAGAPGVDPGDTKAVEDVLTEWSDWYDERFDEPSFVETLVDAISDGEIDPTPNWDERRLAYGVQVAAPDPLPNAPRRGIVLRAASYHGGRLDWDDFDYARHQPLLVGNRSSLPSERRSLLPTPIRYPGAPAQRFWEFEPWEVDLGGIEAGPAEPARMLLAEFGLVFGDDWFQIPLRVPAGSLARVRKLRVIDSFGQVTHIEPASFVDTKPEGRRAWVWTEHSGDPEAETETGPWLFIPPVLAPSLDGQPVEDVLFARDEMANLAWAIERKVENPLGRPFDRRARWQDQRAAVLAAAGTGDDASVAEGGDHTVDIWRYVAESVSPSHWVPLSAVEIDGGPQVELRRSKMAQWEHDPDAGAKSQSMTPWLPRAAVNEEEVPREGTRVTRGWQLARDRNGSVRLWMARRRRTGSGERDSGYRTDAIVRRRSP